jgi:hypothetical protein
MNFEYYIFGSKDSIDIDVLIVHPDSKGLEIDNLLIKQIKSDYSETSNWNINIIQINGGIVINSIPSKGSPDSVHNSLYETYELHQQKYPFPLKTKLERNIPFAIEKCLISIFTFYKKTKHHEFYKSIPKEFKNGQANIVDRLSFLEKIDFKILPYEEEIQNMNAYKSLAFHVGQTISLINGIEIYTKQKLISFHPDLEMLIYRINIEQRDNINKKIIELKNLIIENLNFNRN